MDNGVNKSKDKGCTNAELRQMYPQNKDSGEVIAGGKQKKDYSNNKKATYL